jgi:hypothetical protein
MKLKLTTKPDKGTNQDPLILMVEWGGGETSNGEKIPHKKYIEKAIVGQILQVPDQLGYAIMSRYNGCFEMVHEVVKLTKEVTPAETK